jgi:hypothetical protein
MSQLLFERHSSNGVLKTVKRHMRLCRQNKGTEAHATAIEPVYLALLEKSEASKAATELYENSYDQVVIRDAELDDKVKDLKEAAQKFDREHPGELTTAKLFPNGISPVIYVSYQAEPSIVEQLLRQLNDLGPEHALQVLAEPLQTALNNCKDALNALKQSSESEKSAEGLELIAKLNLNRQYEQNFYAASSKFGKQFASRLFPKITVPSKPQEEVSEVNE